MDNVNNKSIKQDGRKAKALPEVAIKEKQSIADSQGALKDQLDGIIKEVRHESI